MGFSTLQTSFGFRFNHTFTYCIYKEVNKVAMEQGLRTLPEHMNSPRILVGLVLLHL